ncbi:MAG: hypothetical protein J3K34DRAFT_157700 [Monoraphidium minutum]|nr:MAG: hypothetical protein J3K34DRAFT_157700 [Monoraphidium minutum]
MWPYAGFWMTALGFRWADVLSVEVEMATDVVYSVKPDAERGAGATRAEVPADWADVFTSAKINGRDVAASIGSGDTLDFVAGDATAYVHFPQGRHPGEPTDGPVMVIATPAMQITVYLETEDIIHLDFAVSLVKRRITAMHGMLGQSLHWARGAPAAVEGDDDMLYAVAGGELLGADFKYSLFGNAAAAAAKNDRVHRALLLPSMAADDSLMGGSPAAVRSFMAEGNA